MKTKVTSFAKMALVPFLCLLVFNVFAYYNHESSEVHAYSGPCTGPPNILTQPQSGVICSGQTWQMSCIVDCASSYNWMLLSSSGDWIVVGTGSTYTTPALTSTVYYKCMVSNSYGTATSATVSVSIGTTVSVGPTSISASSNPIMAGSSTTLTVQGGVLGSLATWKWYTASCGGSLCGTGNAITVTPVASTTYYVRAEGGCSPTTTCASLGINLNYSITGSGAPNYIPKFSTSSSIINSTIIENGGNVGVGIINPSSKLHIAGGALKVGTNAYGYLTDGGLMIGSLLADYIPSTSNWNTSGSTLLLTGLNYSTVGFHDVGLRVDFIKAGNGTIQLGYNGGWGEANIGMPGNGIWSSTGAVGIGTTTPGTTLDVNGSIAGSYLYMRPQNTTTEGGEIMLLGAGTYTGFFMDNYMGNLRFFPNKPNPPICMTLYPDGNASFNGYASANGTNYYALTLNAVNNKDEFLRLNRNIGTGDNNVAYSIRIGKPVTLSGKADFAITFTGNMLNTTTNQMTWHNEEPVLSIDARNNKMQLRGDVEVAANIGDWVFFDDYNLPSLEEVDTYIKKNGHLPGVISANDVKNNNNGKIALGDFSNRLLVKIEELTLYTIELNKQNKELKAEINDLKAIVNNK